MATNTGTMTRKPGVLPIGPAQIQAQNTLDANKSAKGRSGAAQDGVKAKIRWLPPAMTEDEFVSILGDDWKVGKGKVGWFRYAPGHMPKGYADYPTNTDLARTQPLTSFAYIAHQRIPSQDGPSYKSKRKILKSWLRLSETLFGKMRRAHSATPP